MRYVSGLIPEETKVLPGYFKGSIYAQRNSNSLLNALSWLSGLLLFLAAAMNLRHPVLAAVMLLAGWLIIPPGHARTENLFRFRFTAKLKLIVLGVLLSVSALLYLHYRNTDQQKALVQKAAEEKAAAEMTLTIQKAAIGRAIESKKAEQRKDSIRFYLSRSHDLKKQKKTAAANIQIDRANSFAVSAEEKAQVQNAKTQFAVQDAIALVKSAKYKTALPELNNLLIADPTNKELLLNRAICLSKTGKIAEAVNDLKPMAAAGYTKAQTLYDKINPVRQRVAYYVTRCCDGTTSNSTGRGTCSHHGGVCNWSEPVYEQYRQY